MNFSTQENFELNQKIQEYKKLRAASDKLWDEICPTIKDRCLDILRWENKYLNAGRDMDDPSAWYHYEIEIGVNTIIVSAEISWSLGGHDSWHANIPIEHLFSNDWKQIVLEKHKENTKANQELKARFEPKTQVEPEEYLESITR